MADLEGRRQIWLALSDLFLDSDVTTSYDYIARICAASEYSADELYFILKKEVAPACAANLLCVAGEWAGFNEQWLEQRIVKVRNAKGTVASYLHGFFTNFMIGGDIDAHWANISTKIKVLRESV